MTPYKKQKVNAVLNLDQRGQAMSEALLIIGVFFILITGINISMRMQRSAVQMVLESVKKVFQVHLGNITVGKNPDQVSTFENSDLFRAKANVLFDELNMAQPGFIHARAQITPLSWDTIKISRQTFIEAGSGFASSDQAVQAKIGTSASLWSGAFHHSSTVINPLHMLTSKTDAAWQRPEISRDFIQPWAGVVPEESATRGEK